MPLAEERMKRRTYLQQWPQSLRAHLATLALVLACLTGCSVNKAVHYRIESKYKVSDPQFAQTMGNLLGPAIISGNKVDTLRNGDQIFPAMLEGIRAAQK